MAQGGFSLVKDWNAKPGWGGLKKAFFTLTFSDNYDTAGYDVDLDNQHLGTIRFVYLPPVVAGSPGYVPYYNYATGLIHLYYCDNDALADSGLIELADNSIDLATMTIKFAVEGTGV